MEDRRKKQGSKVSNEEKEGRKEGRKEEDIEGYSLAPVVIVAVDPTAPSPYPESLMVLPLERKYTSHAPGRETGAIER